MTGDEAALHLGYKLARFFSLGHSGFIGPNGEFRVSAAHTSVEDTAESSPYGRPGIIHFHTNTQIRMLLLDAGIAAGDREMVELAQRGYAYGKEHGDTLMGYFPENIGRRPGEGGTTTEICEVADMIYLALRQSTQGIADCWDDVDRWLRNMFTEAQLLETDWAYGYSEKYGVPREHPYAVRDHVPDRWLGAWGGWIAANDWQGNQEYSIAPCCHPNAAMQLYRVWRDMIAFDAQKDRLSVHLLLNRASPWADVNSHIAYTGLVEVMLKRDCEVAFRIPEWTTPQECTGTVNGTLTPVHWEGRYMVVRGKAGDTVSLHCPMPSGRRSSALQARSTPWFCAATRSWILTHPACIIPSSRNPSTGRGRLAGAQRSALLQTR